MRQRTAQDLDLVAWLALGVRPNGTQDVRDAVEKLSRNPDSRGVVCETISRGIQPQRPLLLRHPKQGRVNEQSICLLSSDGAVNECTFANLFRLITIDQSTSARALTREEDSSLHFRAG